MPETGRLALEQDVGYPNPDRSQCRSMAIWHTARPEPEKHKGFGWLGRGLDGGARPADSSSSSLLVGVDAPPLALEGSRSTTSALDRLDDLVLTSEVNPR